LLGQRQAGPPDDGGSFGAVEVTGDEVEAGCGDDWELEDDVVVAGAEATGEAEVAGDAEPDEFADDGGISGLLLTSGFVEDDAGGETATVEVADAALPVGPIFNSRPT